MHKRLTDTAISRAKPRVKPYKLADGLGMYLYVSPSGGKSWRLGYRLQGRQELLIIGQYPAVTLAEARQRRDEARKLIARGESPAAAKQQGKREARAAAANTFRAIGEEWRAKLEPLHSESWRVQIARLLESDIYPAIGAMPIRSVTPADVLAVMQTIADRGAAHSATVARQLVARIYQYAIRTLRAEFDPAQSVRGAIQKPKPKHHPTLSIGELPAFLAAVEQYGGRPQTRLALRLLVLTFTRKMELLGATWDEFDLEGATWRIGAHRMKKREAHVVPLSRQAVECFTLLKSIAGASRYVFPHYARADEPMGEVTINYAIRLMGYSGRMTPHGVRALASTWLHEQGWNPDVIARSLAHAERSATRAAYNRAEYLDERRRMMQVWADHIDARCAGDNVVPLHGRTA